MRHRLLALLLAVAVSVPASAFARVAQVCRMSGATCGCAHRSERTQCKRVAIDRDGCCKARFSQTQKASAALQTSFDVPPAALIGRVAVPTLADRLATGVAGWVARARGPPPVGPPIFLRDCRFLS